MPIALPSDMMTMTFSAAKFSDLAFQYDFCGGATLSRVEFTVDGDAFVAVRFVRADTGSRGVEIYRVDTDGMEMFVGYANIAILAERRAVAALEAVEPFLGGGTRALDLAA